MFRPRPLPLVSAAVLLALLASGCSDDETGPDDIPLTIAPTQTNSGDGQEGVVSNVLDQPLRVIVTRDGQPVEGIAVQWEASNDGVTADDESLTDNQGVAQTLWFLGPEEGEQTARASLDDAQGSPVEFTATAEPAPPPAGTTIQLQAASFEPADVSVALGQTVTWLWPATEVEHNIVPDDNSIPSGSGPPRAGPATYQFTFTQAGVYRYHCVVHGGPGGVGMSGTVTVTSDLP